MPTNILIESLEKIEGEKNMKNNNQNLEQAGVNKW
jgi:hypothetical protein